VRIVSLDETALGESRRNDLLVRSGVVTIAPNGPVAIGLAGSLVGLLGGLATGSVAIRSAIWLDD
jgi:hypothetical protein